jgi:hypothetical protein
MKRDLVPEAAPTTLPAVTADGGLVNPRTGEVVNVDSPDDAVIDLLQFIRDGRALLDTLDGEVSQWLRARADARRTWTLAGGRASMPSDRPTTEWSVTKLAELLPRLVADGHITQGDADACLQTVVVVVSSEVKRVKNAAIPRIAEAIMDCRVEVPRGSRKVQLK